MHNPNTNPLIQSDPINPSSVPVKQIKLTMPESMHLLLKQEQDKYLYKNIQEIILEAIRDKYLRGGEDYPIQEEKRGRPKKITPERILTRKKIFNKQGEAIKL